MKRRLLTLALVAAAAGVARAGTVDLRRGTGSWTSPNPRARLRRVDDRVALRRLVLRVRLGLVAVALSRPKQDAMRDRLSTLEPDEWYRPTSPSERTTLSFMVKRGVVERRLREAKVGFEYRLARPELDLGGFGAQVIPISRRG